MIVDSNITNILSLPTPHSHPEKSLDDLAMEKIRQKMNKLLEQDPTQNLKNVFENVLEENPRQLAPDYKSVGRSLDRSKARTVPSVPHAVFSLHLKNFLSIFLTKISLALWYAHWRKMCKSFGWPALFAQTWCVKRCYNFRNSGSPESFERCTSVLSDGTFKATPEPYDQLYINDFRRWWRT